MTHIALLAPWCTVKLNPQQLKTQTIVHPTAFKLTRHMNVHTLLKLVPMHVQLRFGKSIFWPFWI